MNDNVDVMLALFYTNTIITSSYVIIHHPMLLYMATSLS